MFINRWMNKGKISFWIYILCWDLPVTLGFDHLIYFGKENTWKLVESTLKQPTSCKRPELACWKMTNHMEYSSQDHLTHSETSESSANPLEKLSQDGQNCFCQPITEQRCRNAPCEEALWGGPADMSIREQQYLLIWANRLCSSRCFVPN